jgi:MoxR-like ATPase
MILSPVKQHDVQYIKYLLNNPTVCIPSMLLFGEPGAGKTSFAKHLATELGAELIFAPCYDGVSAEQLVYNWDLGTLVDAMTDENTSGKDAMKDGYLLQALKRSNTHRVVLLIDEIDKAKPSVDTFLLSYMQECLLNDPLTGVVTGNKNNLFVILTSNKRRELEDALDRRISLIREFYFPERSELVEQVKMMLSVPYNETKFNFLIDLVLEYRKLPVQKKPSQNQIADLIQELYFIGSSPLGRKTAYDMKMRSLLWKVSQETSDHEIFKKFMINNFSGKTKEVMHYIGSMI